MMNGTSDYDKNMIDESRVSKWFSANLQITRGLGKYQWIDKSDSGHAKLLETASNLVRKCSNLKYFHTDIFT